MKSNRLPRSRTFAPRLLEWYRREQRDLPWRRTRDPYRIWISEVLLQQTQVTTVIPYYERLLARFPDVEALANARLDDVLKVWEGAGYYARARNLHRAAREIVNERNGKFPRTVEGLLKLPGIGRYTAGAIASIAFKRDVPALDGNAIRVLCRHFGIREDPKTNAVRAQLEELATELIPQGQARDFNQALMELGARVCVARNPRCEVCPLRRSCVARKLGLQNKLPYKRAKNKAPHYEIGVGVLRKRGRILIQQRKPEGLLGGLWEFPGGKRERGESIKDCIAREFEEELCVYIIVRDELAVIEHAYSHFSITLHAFNCEYVSGRIQLRSASAFKWVRPRELKEYAFPAANRKVIAKLSARA